jgi:hypothetical protein
MKAKLCSSAANFLFNVLLTSTFSVKSVQSVYERFFITPIPREPK